MTEWTNVLHIASQLSCLITVQFTWFHSSRSIVEIVSTIVGPALTAVWPKASSLTARCLSPLPGFESRPGHVRKLPVIWG